MRYMSTTKFSDLTLITKYLVIITIIIIVKAFWQARIHTGFHRFMEIGQIFKNDSKSRDMVFLESENLKHFWAQTLGNLVKFYHGPRLPYNVCVHGYAQRGVSEWMKDKLMSSLRQK